MDILKDLPPSPSPSDSPNSKVPTLPVSIETTTPVFAITTANITVLERGTGILGTAINQNFGQTLALNGNGSIIVVEILFITYVRTDFVFPFVETKFGDMSESIKCERLMDASDLRHQWGRHTEGVWSLNITQQKKQCVCDWITTS